MRSFWSPANERTDSSHRVPRRRNTSMDINSDSSIHRRPMHFFGRAVLAESIPCFAVTFGVFTWWDR